MAASPGKQVHRTKLNCFVDLLTRNSSKDFMAWSATIRRFFFLAERSMVLTRTCETIKTLWVETRVWIHNTEGSFWQKYICFLLCKTYPWYQSLSEFTQNSVFKIAWPNHFTNAVYVLENKTQNSSKAPAQGFKSVKPALQSLSSFLLGFSFASNTHERQAHQSSIHMLDKKLPDASFRMKFTSLDETKRLLRIITFG